MEIDIYELRSEIMDVLHVLDEDPDGAHDLLVKMSEKYEAAQHSVQSDGDNAQCPHGYFYNQDCEPCKRVHNQ